MSERPTNIRRPAAAGMFYPASAVELTKTIAGLYAQVEKAVIPGRPLALICPHAGYPYSGHTAAKAYKLLEGLEYDTVVVVSPSHTVFFRGSSVYDGDGYETPLGTVETDHELSEKIAKINPLVHAGNQGHATGMTRGEHALEVQLPFLQIVLGKFKLVAIVMGDQEEESVRALGEVLGAALKDRNCLMVASTDLSHFHTEKEAVRLDRHIRAAIEAFDPGQLMETLAEGKGEACGGGPVASVMIAAQRLGSTDVQFLEYTTSGQATGDFEEVVGYLSAVILAGKQAARAASSRQALGSRAAQPGAGEITEEGKQALKRIVGEAIVARRDGREYVPEPVAGLHMERGLFITLKVDREPRGTAGTVKARQALYLAAAELAAEAYDDPRCKALSPDELEQLECEIEVLGPLKRVKDFSEIKVGRDGLMIKLDMHTGLVLPQVAVEAGWSARELLEQTCLHAGLPKDSYKDKFAEIYRFEAEVF